MSGDLVRAEARTRALPSQERLPASGDYWRCTRQDGDTRPTMGRVYLVAKVHVIDGELHSLQLGQHPEERQSWRLMLEEFLETFEYAADGKQVRDGEMAAVARRIDELQRRITAPPPDIQTLLAAPDAAGASTTVTDLVAAGVPVATLQQRAEHASNMLAQHAETIREVSKSIGEETQTLARYHSERANAAIAQVSETIAHAEHLQRGVRTLGLYAGDGVEVHTLVEGEGAAPDHPLTIFQRRLYLDEELLCRLDEGGADFSDDGTLATMLRTDAALRDRIIPGPRSVVLMRYRRYPKQRDPSNGDLASAFRNVLRAVAEDEASEQPFLLVRNGSQIHQVFADEALKPIERLFPRAVDVEDIYTDRGWRFSGIESRTITVRDLEYVDRRSKFENMALLFRRVLTLLWGLDNRLDLFGRFYDRRQHPTMLTMDFQERHMRFVADEENALEEGRPNFAQLQKTQNALIQPGSRIAIQWRKAMDSESCPGAVRERRDMHGHWTDNFLYLPVEHVGIAVVRMSKGRLVAKAPCRRPYRDEDIKNFEIDLSKADACSYFCIDGMTAADLEWYVQSRRERANYLAYVRIFQQAIKLLQDEEEKQRVAMADLRERAGRPQERDHLATALRMWRAAHSGQMLPMDDARALESAKRSILQMAETLAHGAPRGDVIAKIEDAVAQAGRTAVRIAAKADGSYVVDADLSDAERLKHVPNAWFVRLGADRAGSLHKREEHRTPAKEPKSAIVLKDGKVDVVDLPWRDATWKEAVHIDDALQHADRSPLYAMLRDGVEENVEEYLWRSSRAAAYDGARLAWTRSFIPLALYREEACSHASALKLAGLSASPFDLIALSSPQGRRLVEAYVNRSYQNPETHLKHLEGVRHVTALRMTTGHIRAFLDEHGYAGAYGRHWETMETPSEAFDSQDQFLAALAREGRMKDMQVVSWSDHADAALALARRYTNIEDGE